MLLHPESTENIKIHQNIYPTMTYIYCTKVKIGIIPPSVAYIILAQYTLA